MRRSVVAAAAAVVLVAGPLLWGCSGGGGSSSATSSTTGSAGSTLSKVISGSGGVALGSLANDGFSLALPSDAYPTVAAIEASRVSVASAPPMTSAAILGDGISVDSGGVGRLEDRATLTLQYDPASTPDPMLLALGYHDGTAWTYISVETVDRSASTVTFPIFHFSAYYPARFTSELEAAKFAANQMATRKVLGEGGGDPKVASRQLADFLAEKLGLGEDEFSRRMLADIAADQELVKVFDQYQTEGWSDAAYEHVMDAACAKVVELLTENSDALGASNGSGLSTTGAAFQHMGDVLRAGGQNGARFLGYVLEGDTNAAAKELFDLATDYTGAPGKAIKYTLQGMKNAVDVWRDTEVENAFRVYTEGSDGTIFGYGAVTPGEFDAVWEYMKGASRQLVIERLATENEARAIAGMDPLTPREEDFYREKVKQELKAEFDRRIAVNTRIAAYQKNLELIFAELDAAKLFDGSNVWIRRVGDLDETLESRLVRFNRLIERIMTNLKVDSVYAGQQRQGPLGGRISAAAMGEMVRGYFAADTQDEGEAFLQEYYRTLRAADSLDGHWVGAAVVESIDCPYPYGCGGLGQVYQITFDLRTDANGAVIQTGSSVDNHPLAGDPGALWDGTTLTMRLTSANNAGDLLTGTATRNAQGVITKLSGTWVRELTMVDTYADPPVAKTTITRGSWSATRAS